MKRILVIEDNSNLAYGLQNNLEIEGYEVLLAADGNEGLATARSGRPNLVILDLMLPGKDGFRVLKELRDDADPVPVLILSARGEEIDKVRGFRFGADDYVTKPFSLLELLGRIEALLRRSEGFPRLVGRRTERFGAVEVDSGARVVRKNGVTIALAPKEYDLLWELLRLKGAVASRLDLIRTVWGYSDSVLTRTVDTHIGELRRKLEDDPGNPKHILTVRKVGYRLRQ